VNKLKRWKVVTDAGLSAASIADAVGRNKATVSRLLNGETWSAETAEAVARQVGLTAADMWPKQVGRAA
jgi:plasmid maintenance system antidote protein VapI